MKYRKKDRAFESAASCICHWPKAQRGIDELRRRGIDSFASLAGQLPKLSVRLRRIALWIMAHATTPAIEPIFLQLLQDRRLTQEVYSAWSLGINTTGSTGGVDWFGY